MRDSSGTSTRVARCRPARIDLLRIRHEHEIAARGAQHLRIFRRRARVVREVLVGAELHRIYENARNEARRAAARRLDQADVARMQVAHGWHKGDALAILRHWRTRARTAAIVVTVSIELTPQAQKECSAAGYSRFFTACT